jgi:hypothetical protein
MDEWSQDIATSIKCYCKVSRLRGWNRLSYNYTCDTHITQFMFIIVSFLKDEWLFCQRSWLYLKPILSAPGIQRQLPNESKIFIIVDRSFKEVMQKTAKVRTAHYHLLYYLSFYLCGNFVWSVNSLRWAIFIYIVKGFHDLCHSSLYVSPQFLVMQRHSLSW